MLTIIDSLSCAAVASVGRNVDWQEARGDDCEGWRSFEAVTCGECGKVFVLDCGGNEKHCDIDSDSECQGYVGSAEGPMMNYFYPVELKDCEEAARQLVDLPLCVVEFRDGETGLALTGGGMDLRWEICEAFVKLGFLPPTEFTRLPAMSGKALRKRERIIVAACIKSNEVQQGWLQSNIEDIKRTVKSIRKYNRRG